MAEVRISEIKNELINPAASDRLEIADMDGDSGTPQTKYIKFENIGGSGGVSFFDSTKTYDAGGQVLRSETASDDGSYNGSVNDYRLYICQSDSTSGTWGAVKSNFQEVVFVTSDGSLDGDGYPGSNLSVNIDNTSYPTGSSTTEDGTTISTVTEALDFLLANADFYIVADDTERNNLATEEGRLIYNQNSSTFQKYEGGSWKDVTIYTDSELTTWLSGRNVTELSDVQDAGSQKIISEEERSVLIPTVHEVASTTDTFQAQNGTQTEYLTDSGSGYWVFNIDPILNGDIVVFKPTLNLSGNPIVITLPISDTSGDYFAGWHCYFLPDISVSVDVKKPDSEPSGSLIPFDRVTITPEFMISVFNTSNNNSLWSASGNIIDST